MSKAQTKVEWPRRGEHWDVFNGRDIQPIDEGNEPPYWPDGRAAAFVIQTSLRHYAAPDDVVEECREAIREIVKSWEDELDG